MKKTTAIILTLLLSCATFMSAQVTIIGATEASAGAINKSYSTLKAAFDAINTNASGLATDVLSIEVSANTAETAAPTTLYAPLGISSVTVTPGATTYKMPVITLTGGTKTGATGTFVITIYNGKIINIVNTGGTWTAVPTVSIEGPGGVSSLTGVTTQATAFCTTSTTNLTFYITDGGAGYGPRTSVTATSGGSGAAVGLALISAATTAAGTGPYTLSPTAVAVSGSYLDYAGSGYTTGATAPVENTIGGTFASGTAATASYAIGISTANYASVKIYPTAANLTISATSTGNQPFIVLNGASNVTIDGRVHTAGVPSGSADLTIQYNSTNASTNNASTIYLNAGANHNTITYCKLKSNTQNGNTRGTLAIGTNSTVSTAVASSVGGSYNTISYNAFSAYSFTETFKGNGGLITCACSNDDFPNINNTIDSNTFDNYFISGPTGNISAAIYVYGNANPNKPVHSNYTITNNSFFHSVDGATTANANRMFIKVGASSLYGGYGHIISGNYMGGSAANCSGTLTKTGVFQDNLTGISLYSSPGAACSIQGNVMKGISWSNGSATPSNIKFLDINGLGDVNIGTITGNTLGDNATGSITNTSTAATGSANMYGIFINTTGAVSCQDNTIGSITLNNSTVTNFAGIWKSLSAGDCTISNNTIGSATVLNSILNNSGSTQWVYPIYSAGTGTINLNNNTIANITNNTSTGNLFGIFHEAGANLFNVNANLIHSLNVTSTSTAAKVVGIYCNSGTNLITNNIVKLNGDNAATMYGLDEEETATASNFYHNTVYISGAPTTGALNSACIASNGSTNSRNIQNNIFVNARTNNAAIGSHYALYMPSSAGTVVVNANDYQATGASGAMLGYSAAADVSALPIVATQDASSLSVNPGFALEGGTLAANYMTSATLTAVSAGGVTTDYAGATRAAIQMGAWNKSTSTDVNNLVENGGIIVTCKNNQIVISCKNELKSDASISVYNVVGKKLVSERMLNTVTVLDKTFEAGIYLVSIKNAFKTSTRKIVVN